MCRSGSTCYRSCDGRVLLTNVTEGALGTHSRLHPAVSVAELGTYKGAQQESSTVYCMWILTVWPELDPLEYAASDQSPGSSSDVSTTTPVDIVLNVEDDYKVTCYKVWVLLRYFVCTYLFNHVRYLYMFIELVVLCRHSPHTTNHLK